tara:strand:- start:14 stop:3043 length:3030 start_codon:yes stop_codon:yes gene_type:complete
MTPQEELQALRASRNKQPLSAQEELKQLRDSRSRKKLRSFEELVTTANDKDEQMFDYTTGARGGLRAKLSFMETPEEKENFLLQRVGASGFTKDSQGRLALTPEGQAKEGMKPIDKNLVIEEESFTLRDISDVAGLAPETIGSIIGGVLGAPGGIFTSALGAAGGAAGGQLIEEGIEKLLGLQKQTLGEVAKDAGTEALLAGTIDLATMGTYKGVRALIQGAGKSANVAARALGQGERQLGQAQAEQALRIMDEGGMPSYEAAGMPAAVSRASQIAEAISGKEKRALQNVIFALGKKQKLLQDAGIMDSQGNVIAGATSDDLAKVISDAAPTKAKQLQQSLDDAQKAHMNAIDETISILTKSTKEGTDIDDAVLDVLMYNYDEFAKGANANYKAVDDKLAQITGNVKVNGRNTSVEGGELPVFDIRALKTRFDDIISSKYGGASSTAPEEFTAIGSQIKDLVNRGRGAKKGFTTFNGLRALRKNIQDTLMDPRLSISDTTPRRLLVDLRQTVDNMLQGNVQLTGIGGKVNATKMREAMDLLQDANKAYRAEMRTFNRLETLGIVRNLGEPGVNVKLEVGRNYDKIIQSPARITAALDAAKGQREVVRQDLAKRYLDEALLDSNKDFADPTKFNGVQFYGKIKRMNRDKTGKLLFGDQWPEVQNLAKSLAYGGVKKIDDATLQRIVAQNPDAGIVQTLRSVRDAQVGLEEASQSSILKRLNSGTLDPEEAAAAITNRNMTRAQMNRILKFFDDSPEAQETIRRTIVNDILGSVDEDIFINEKAAYSLRNAIDSYKPEMLNKVLGEQAVKDMKQMADDLVFLRDTGAKGAGSLAADAIRTGQFTNPMKNIPKAARFRVLNYMFNNPTVMRTALEVKAGRTSPQAAAQSLTQALNESAAQVTGSGVPLTERATGVAKGVGQIADRLARSATTRRQVAGQLLTSPQEVKGTPPPQSKTPVPQVLPPVTTENLRIMRQVDPANVRNQQNLRERAKRNPYIAASLLGGLGSAGLL